MASSTLLPAGFGFSLTDWRNHLIANPKFQRWASATSLMRPLAQRNSRALFDLTAGFVYSQILSACIKLGLFDFLHKAGPSDAAAVAAETKLSPAIAQRLLRAAAALRLLKPAPGGKFGLGDLGAAVVGNPGVADFVKHHELLYADLADPVALLRGEKKTRLSQFWSYADKAGDGGADKSVAYSALMAGTQALLADAVLGAYPFSTRRCLLDVGGGEGGFVAAVAEKLPGVKITMLDLAPVARRAKAKLADLGLEDRIDVVAGDMLKDPWPEGADVVTLVRVLHDHDDEEALRILKAAHDVLPHNGDIVIAEPMSGVSGAEQVGDAYFGFYLLAMGRGRARTSSEIGALLTEAGFGRPLSLRTPNPFFTSIVTAFRV